MSFRETQLIIYLILPCAVHNLQGDVARHLAYLLPRRDLPHLRLDQLVQTQLVEGVEVEVEGEDDRRKKEGETYAQHVTPYEDVLRNVIGDVEAEGLGPAHSAFGLN